MTNRSAVKDRLVTIATAALQSVDLGVADRDAETIKVAYGLPPDDATESAFYFGGYETARTEGTTEPTSIGPNGKFSDRWTQKAVIDVFGFASEREAEKAAEAVLNAFLVFLHGRCANRLIDSQGEIETGDSTAYRCGWARLSDWSLEPFAPPGDTFVARIELSIDCTNPQA